MFPFFGLTQEYKLGLHDEVFSLVYYGKGGFTVSDVRDLPIYIRRYFIRRLKEEIDKKNRAEKDAYDSSKKKVSMPTFQKK
jgi:hypothetical protein